MRVAAVVVTYNRREFLHECLEALLAQTRPLDEIIVIDNASTDGTSEYINSVRHENDCIVYVRLNENLGGAGGFCQGIRLAYERGHDWIWVLDDDVAPESTCLEILMAHSDSLELLVPLRIDKATGQNVELAATKLDLSNPLVKDPRRSWIAREYPDPELLPDVFPLEDFSFEGPLFHRNVISRIGYPNPNYFILGDDLDYALRFRAVGGLITLVKNARIYRLASAPPLLTEWRIYYAYRNIWYIHRVYGKNTMVRMKPILWFVSIVLKHAWTPRGRKRIGLTALAFADAMKGRLGPRLRPP